MVDGSGGDPRVSVVVPVLNGADVLPSLLRGLSEQQGAPPFEVVVVDNGSSDRTAAIASAHPIVGRVISERRPGSYAARNAGIESTKGEVLAFVDADCVPEPDWLTAGLVALETADLVGGAIVPLRSSEPTSWEIYDRATYLNQQEMVSDQDFAATANLFVRRSVFEAVGLFDGRLKSSGDFELCRRAVAGGFRLTYAAEARVSHRPRRSFEGVWRLNVRLGAGWADLARLGLRPRAWRDRAMWIPLSWVAHAVATAGDPLRYRRLVSVHGVVTLARWAGRLRGGLHRLVPPDRRWSAHE